MLNVWTRVQRAGHVVKCGDDDLYHDIICPVHRPYGTILNLACLTTMPGT